jgi:biotin synthase
MGLLTKQELLGWLKETDENRLQQLWAEADRVRREHVGEAVHLRGLIEISNYCVRRCAYCGLRVERTKLARYRMTADEVLASARDAVKFGYGTVVLQAGEDPGWRADEIADVVRRIKSETALAVTLSLGERSPDEWKLWHAAGADRYLLRFETSNRKLYDLIHPAGRNGQLSDRIAMLRELRAIGYEIGSGVMAGIPGQTYDDLARDLETFRELDLDMIGIGPFIPHPDTPLGGKEHGRDVRATADEQPPADELMTLKMVALTRLMCPRANIPSTTALATLNLEQGRELGLQRGANIVMPNVTPLKYRALYEIYPGKACIQEDGAQCSFCLRGRLAAIGRPVGQGPGSARTVHLI